MSTLETLELLYRNYDPASWMVVSTCDESKPSAESHYLPKSFQINSLPDVAKLVDNNRESGIYTSAAVFKTKPSSGGTKAEVLCSNKLWTEIDYERDGLDKKRSYERLLAYDPQPSLIVHSGHGFHAYWFLKELLYDAKAIDDRNYYLKVSFGSDSIFDASRKLRLPGTVNVKRIPHVVSEIVYRNAAEYSASDFKSLCKPRYEDPIEFEREELPDNFENDVKSKPGGRKIWRQIFSFESAQGVAPVKKAGPEAGMVDRSLNDYDIAKWLLSSGYSYGIVASVLTHPSWLSGDKSRARGRSYYELTITKAAYKVASMELPDVNLFSEDTVDKDGNVRKGKYSQAKGVAAISEAFHVQTYMGVPHAYIGDVYEADVLDELVYSVLKKKLGNALTEQIVAQTVKLLEREAKSILANEEDPKHWINVENGLLNLDSEELVNHTHTIFTPGRISARWAGDGVNPEAEKRFVAFIGSVIEEENEAIYSEHMGLCLSTFISKEVKLLMLLGRSNTGKSQVIQFSTGFIGDEYTAAVEPSSLADEKFYIPALRGKRLNGVNDTNVDYIMKYAVVLNQILSGEALAMNQKNVKVKPMEKLYTKHIAATNKPMFARSVTEGFEERLLVLACNHIFKDGDEDKVVGISQQLLLDPEIRSAALKRFVAGYRRFMKKGGYTVTASSREATLAHKKEVDAVIGYLLDKCVHEDGAIITQAQLKEQIQNFCLREDGGKFPGLKEMRYRIEAYSKSHPEELRIKYYKAGEYPGHSSEGNLYVGMRIKEIQDTTIHPHTHSNGNGKVHA